MLLLLGWAVAGQLTLEDPGHRLSPADRSRVERAVEPLPYDVHAVVDDARAAEAELARYAETLRTNEGGLVIAVDPTHRHTVVEFDAAVGVKQGSFDEVRRAGDPSFRQAAWGGGVLEIVRTAEAARHRSGNTSSTPSNPDAETPTWVVVLVGLGGSFLALVGMVFVARVFGPSGRAPRNERGGFGADWGAGAADSGGSDSGSSSGSGGDSGGSSGSW